MRRPHTREERQRQRLSQTQLAARVQCAGVTIERDSLSRIEAGKRFVADFELKVFADVLGVSLLWLIGESESKNGIS